MITRAPPGSQSHAFLKGRTIIGEQASELGGIVQMENMILDKVTGLHKGCGDGCMFKKSKS